MFYFVFCKVNGLSGFPHRKKKVGTFQEKKVRKNCVLLKRSKLEHFVWFHLFHLRFFSHVQADLTINVLWKIVFMASLEFIGPPKILGPPLIPKLQVPP